MTSNIKNFTDNIDTNFPVQGRDNPSQGFRDNFAQIKLALVTAADEISNVQTASSTPNFTLTTATSSVLGGVKIGTGFRVEGDGTLFIDDVYVLPVATPLSLGGVRQGDNVAISGDGTISVADPYALPNASASVLGGVKIGNGLKIDGSGVASLDTTIQNPFPIPAANAFDFGLVKIGANVTIADGFISVAAPYSLPAATPSVLGGVRVGANISVAVDGTISVGNPYVLPAATTSTLGGVIAGAGITINGSGVISAPYVYTLPLASTSTVGGVKVGDNVFVDSEGIISVTAPYELPTASNTVKGGAKIGNGLTVDGSGFLNIDVSALTQNVLPDTNITRDLGSTTRRWRDLYLSSSTIYLGSNTITSSGTSVVIPGLRLNKLGAVAAGVVSTSTVVGGDTRYTVNSNFWADNEEVYGPYTVTPVVTFNNQYTLPNLSPTIRVELASGYIKDIIVDNPGLYTDGNSFSSVNGGFIIEPASNETITLTAKSVGLVPPGGGSYTGDFFNQAFTYTWDGSEPIRGESLIGVTTTYGLLKTWRQTYGYYKVIGSTLVEVDQSEISLGDPVIEVLGSIDNSTYFDTPLPFTAVQVGEVAFSNGKLAAAGNLQIGGTASVAGNLTVKNGITFTDGSILVSAISTLPLYTTSTLSTIVSTATGAMVLITDLVGGPLPCFFDGADWKTFAGTAI